MSSIEKSSIQCRVLNVEFRNVIVVYPKVEIRKSRIKKVSDATFISDVVLISKKSHFHCRHWRISGYVAKGTGFPS